MANVVFATTTPFQSARIVTTDGSPSYTNLENCSATDGSTCDRAVGSGYANLYFRDFGTYEEFGMPQGSKISRVRIRVTGKTGASAYIGLSSGTTYTNNCQWPPDLWSVSQLIGQSIATQTFVKDVIENSQLDSLAYCLQPSAFENKSFIWRINYSSSQLWSADIDNFEIAFDYDVPTPTLTPSPTITPTPTPTPAPAKSPLILIPGIGGSEFKTAEFIDWSQPDGHGGTFTHAYPAGEKVWVNTIEALKPGDDDYFDVLRLKPDGQTSEANLALTGSLFAYQQMVDFFVSSGYTIDSDLFVFPYDWRKDIALTAPLLDEKIESIKQQTGSTKVDIVAHSMGGLVARNYIADVSRASKVNKLFILGTPHLGSAKFLSVLRYGSCLRYEIGPVCLSAAPLEVKDVLQNATGGFELAPTKKYFSFYDGSNSQLPYPLMDVADLDSNGITGVLNYSQIKTFLSNLGHNANLFGPSEAFHNLDDNLINTNGVEVVNIVGSGIPTLGQIIEKNAIDFLGITIPYRDEITINGDQTVPLFSASLTDPERTISFLGDAKVYYTKQEHGNLISPGPALNLVKNILNNDAELPNGILTHAYLLNGTRISTHSPVALHIYDAFGNHTGPTPDDNYEETIPGSSYETLGDATFIWLPNDGQYTIKIEATGQGSFDLKLKTFKDDVNTSTTLYHDIPLTTSTKAQAVLDTMSAQPPVLHIDTDGDGTEDKAIDATSTITGVANNDETPPQTIIALAGQRGDHDWYRSDVLVTLTAQDNASGSGVHRIEYSLDKGQTVQEYDQPFIVSKDGTTEITFRSIDLAGNEEAPQKREINIDKIPPEASIVIDKDTQDIIVTGIDANPTTVTKFPNSYTIRDVAGNTLRLDVRELDINNWDRLSVVSMIYNNNPPIKMPDNYLNVLSFGRKDTAQVIDQHFTMGYRISIQIIYISRVDKSIIIAKQLGKPKTIEVKNGLVLLQLLTNNGNLEVKY